MKFRVESVDSVEDKEIEISRDELLKNHLSIFESDGQSLVSKDGSITYHPEDEDAEFFVGSLHRDFLGSFNPVLEVKSKRATDFPF